MRACPCPSEQFVPEHNNSGSDTFASTKNMLIRWKSKDKNSNSSSSSSKKKRKGREGGK